MKIAIHTLGCKVNQYETQAIEGELLRRGHQLVPFQSRADAYIINTCTVTAVSDQKSRQSMRRARKLNAQAVIAVCGCYPQVDPQAVAALDVDLIAGTGERLAFLDLLENAMEEKSAPRLVVDDVKTRRTFEQLPAGGMEGRTRAMLKIEDGCVNFCSYCIIPYARGRVRSLHIEQTMAEVARLVAAGYREIVLTGIEISSWGQDLPGGEGLIDLLEAVCHALPADVRLRLGSLEPRTITEDFCVRSAQLPQLCPHFHLSMQSGCDATLKRMNRKYDTARYAQSVQLLRQHFENPAITTDMIVGFPQESEAEFDQTVAFIQQCAFSSMHIFPYSIRPGTPAAAMEGQVAQSVKEARSRRGGAVAKAMSETYLSQWVGHTLPVLFETEHGGLWRGFTPQYIQVNVPGEGLHNTVHQVKVTGVVDGGLTGTLVE